MPGTPIPARERTGPRECAGGGSFPPPASLHLYVRSLPSSDVGRLPRLPSHRRPEQQQPADHEGDPAERRDEGCPPRRAEGESVEAPREEEDPRDEEPPRRRARPNGQEGRGLCRGKEGEGVIALVARGKFVGFESFGCDAPFQGMGTKGAEGDAEEPGDRSECEEDAIHEPYSGRTGV